MLREQDFGPALEFASAAASSAGVAKLDFHQLLSHVAFIDFNEKTNIRYTSLR
jgi:hypothetical protein